MKHLFFYIVIFLVFLVLYNLVRDNFWAIEQAKGLIENHFLVVSQYLN